jgi:hypothetical protein
MRLGRCWACQAGDHKHHKRIVEAAPKGMLGGVVCPCKGECQRDQSRQRFLDRMLGGVLSNPAKRSGADN